MRHSVPLLEHDEVGAPEEPPSSPLTCRQSCAKHLRALCNWNNLVKFVVFLGVFAAAFASGYWSVINKVDALNNRIADLEHRLTLDTHSQEESSRRLQGQLDRQQQQIDQQQRNATQGFHTLQMQLHDARQEGHVLQVGYQEAVRELQNLTANVSNQFAVVSNGLQSLAVNTSRQLASITLQLDELNLSSVTKTVYDLDADVGTMTTQLHEAGYKFNSQVAKVVGLTRQALSSIEAANESVHDVGKEVLHAVGEKMAVVGQQVSNIWQLREVSFPVKPPKYRSALYRILNASSFAKWYVAVNGSEVYVSLFQVLKATSNGIRVFDANTGELLRVFGGASQFAGVAVNASELFAAEDVPVPAVRVFDSVGRVLRSFLSNGSSTCRGKFTEPLGLAVDGDLVYVVDYAHYCIQVFDSQGIFQRSWGSKGSGRGQIMKPAQILVAGSMVYLVDYGNNRVHVFDTYGKLVHQWNVSGPMGISVTSTRILVTSLGTKSVLVFSPLPDTQFLYSFGADHFKEPYGVAVISGSDFSGQETVVIADRSTGQVSVYGLNDTTLCPAPIPVCN